MERGLLLALLGADAIAARHAWRLSSRLPETVMSHFDAAGRANGWMPRGTFLAEYVALVVLFNLIAIAPAAALEHVPNLRFNLPNKAYWLDPARRAGTLAWLRGWMYAMATASVLFIAAVMRFAAEATLGTAQATGLTTLIGIFLGVVAILIVAIPIRFSGVSE